MKKDRQSQKNLQNNVTDFGDSECISMVSIHVLSYLPHGYGCRENLIFER